MIDGVLGVTRTRDAGHARQRLDVDDLLHQERELLQTLRGAAHGLLHVPQAVAHERRGAAHKPLPQRVGHDEVAQRDRLARERGGEAVGVGAAAVFERSARALPRRLVVHKSSHGGLAGLQGRHVREGPSQPGLQALPAGGRRGVPAQQREDRVVVDQGQRS